MFYETYRQTFERSLEGLTEMELEDVHSHLEAVRTYSFVEECQRVVSLWCIQERLDKGHLVKVAPKLCGF